MTRVFTLEDTAAILDTFQKHGHKEIDTARVYGEGSSEEYLGNPLARPGISNGYEALPDGCSPSPGNGALFSLARGSPRRPYG